VFVVHWGACDSALQYWQEVGRAGRDNKKAKAYMYATKSSIVHINDDMKNICNGVKNGTISCFRKAQQILRKNLSLINGMERKNRVLILLIF
jgi:superfamily II DNA helicase RecQ